MASRRTKYCVVLCKCGVELSKVKGWSFYSRERMAMAPLRFLLLFIDKEERCRPPFASSYCRQECVISAILSTMSGEMSVFQKKNGEG